MSETKGACNSPLIRFWNSIWVSVTGFLFWQGVARLVTQGKRAHMSSSWNDRSTWQPSLQTPLEEFGQPLKPPEPCGRDILRAKLSDCTARCSCAEQVQWETQQGLASPAPLESLLLLLSCLPKSLLLAVCVAPVMGSKERSWVGWKSQVQWWKLWKGPLQGEHSSPPTTSSFPRVLLISCITLLVSDMEEALIMNILVVTEETQQGLVISGATMWHCVGLTGEADPCHRVSVSLSLTSFRAYSPSPLLTVDEEKRSWYLSGTITCRMAYTHHLLNF